MNRPKKGPRLYTRNQGGQVRYWADLRSVGRGRVALIPEGETLATTDPAIAQKLLSDLVVQLQEERRDKTLLGVRRRATLKEYAAEHLVRKAKSGAVTERHLSDTQHRLEAAVEFFGAERDLASIGVEHVQDYLGWLAERETGRGTTLSASTQRKYLSALSNLLRRAQGEGLIRGVNPVEALLEKPSPEAQEAPWLEVWEAALLLDAARVYAYDPPESSTVAGRLRSAIGTREVAEAGFIARMREAGKLTTPDRLAAYLSGERIPDTAYLRTAARVLGVPEEHLLRGRGWLPGSRSRPSPMMHPLLATFLLTGGRRAEVFGLELGDVTLQRGVVTFRPNQRRRLKTKTSRRNVPLWPQLREILEPYLEERRRQGATDADLLFHSPQGGGMLDNIGKALDAIARTVGWQRGEVRPKAFRHAYASARVQTLDRGHPVSEYTVAKEMGHGGFELVKRVYGHLGQVHHRSEVVEYRIEQQREVIPPERLRLLFWVA